MPLYQGNDIIIIATILAINHISGTASRNNGKSDSPSGAPGLGCSVGAIFYSFFVIN